MGYVTKEEVECKSCGRIIRKNELQYDSTDGRICSDCYTGKQPRQTTPLKETPRLDRLIEEVKGFFVGLTILIVMGLVWLFLFVGWTVLPTGSLTFEIVGASFFLYSIAIVVILAYSSFTSGSGEGFLGGIGLLIIAGALCIFMVMWVWKGLLVVLLFAGIGVAIWVGIGKLRERGKAVSWELEDQLRELKEQLGRGAITQEEYEQKEKELLKDEKN